MKHPLDRYIIGVYELTGLAGQFWEMESGLRLQVVHVAVVSFPNERKEGAISQCSFSASRASCALEKETSATQVTKTRDVERQSNLHHHHGRTFLLGKRLECETSTNCNHSRRGCSVHGGRKILFRLNFSFGLLAKISVGVVTEWRRKRRSIVAAERLVAAMFVFVPARQRSNLGEKIMVTHRCEKVGYDVTVRQHHTKTNANDSSGRNKTREHEKIT